MMDVRHFTEGKKNNNPRLGVGGGVVFQVMPRGPFPFFDTQSCLRGSAHELGACARSLFSLCKEKKKKRARAQPIWAAVMCLGLSRHYWRPLPLELEVISPESGCRQARRARRTLQCNFAGGAAGCGPFLSSVSI